MHQLSSYPQAPEPSELTERSQATHPNQIRAVDKTDRTFQIAASGRLQNVDETALSRVVIDAQADSIGDTLPPRVGRAALSTVPAKSSFEERQYELVRRGLMSIEDARARVEGYRERRRLSVARFVGGAA